MHVVTVLFNVVPKYREEFRSAIATQASASLSHSKGCRRFDVSFSVGGEKVFLYELYDAAEDFQAHLRTKHFSEFSARTKDWVISKQVAEYSLANETLQRPGLGLVAHDACKQRMANWVKRNKRSLCEYELYATETTGKSIRQHMQHLCVTSLASGPRGGDVQMGSLIVEGRIKKLVFFVDPLSPQPHDVDIKALTRVAILQNIELAMNEETADRLL